MKLAKYRKIDTAARLWSLATETGNRKQYQKYNDLIAGEFKKEHRTSIEDAPKSYDFVVIQKKINRGTRNYPEIYNVVMTIAKDRITKITEKSLIVDNGAEHMNTSYIIGFITR